MRHFEVLKRGLGRGGLEASLIAVLVAMAIGSALMLVIGVAPGHVWAEMVRRTFEDPYALGQVLYRATGLAMCGLAVGIALDAGLFNIGAEGQLAAGTLACALVGAALPKGTPSIVAIPACLLAAAAAGGMLGAVVGALRAWRGAHEVITSIMLNAIVANVLLWIGNAFVFQNGTTRGPEIVPSAVLPNLGFSGSPVSAALFLALALILVMHGLRSRTTWGQAWRTVGRDPDAARSVGIAVPRVQTLAMTASGALAGLAAANFVMGHKHAFEEGLGRGTGFLGIAVALLGRSSPIGIGVASLVLGFLAAGGLAVGDLVPKELTEMLQGVVVLAVAAAGPWVERRRAARNRSDDFVSENRTGGTTPPAAAGATE